MKKLFTSLMLALAAVATPALACTNFIITRGASTDGSNMVTYAADSHGLYGALYQYVPDRYTEFMDVTEWDTGRYIGKIKQAPVTYRTLGNSNEHSLFITETTFGGRPELEDPNGGIDYGSLIYITLQRCKTAREAIDMALQRGGDQAVYKTENSTVYYEKCHDQKLHLQNFPYQYYRFQKLGIVLQIPH